MKVNEKPKESLKGMGWGYYRIYPDMDIARANKQGEKVPPLHTEIVRQEYKTTGLDYLLVGCEPPRMFKPGTEPPGFRWWWWDNSMMPHLRYVNVANPEGQKWWSRITFCGWSMPKGTTADQSHRDRINRRLHEQSDGKFKDISDIWGGCVDTRQIKKKHALVCASSERNHREFYNDTRQDWTSRVCKELKRQGYTYEIREKVGVNARKINQVADQIKRGGCDLLITNHSAAASEGVICGIPVVLTSEWNGAWEVATPWQDFCKTGNLNYYTKDQINNWVTKICAYTYHRQELDNNEWIQVHPQAEHLR